MKKLVYLVTISLLLGLLAPLAYAQDPNPPSIPNGPWVEDPQNVQLQAFLTIDELGKKLQDIEARSKGRMKLEIVGYSNLGRPIYAAKFGQPSPAKVGIYIQSSIHGDEQAHVITSVELIQTLAMSGNKDVLGILDKLTVWVVPMLNPDGNMFEVDGKWWPQRLNVQTWNPAAFGLPDNTLPPFYYNQRYGIFGYDLNRDFHPELDYVLGPTVNHRPTSTWRGASRDAGFMVAPETHAAVSLFKALKPKLFIDLHHQYPTYAQSRTDNGMNTLQILGVVMTSSSYTDRDGKTFQLNPEVAKLSKQVNSLVYQKLTENGNSLFGNVTKYAPINYPGSALGAFTLNGASIMLYEARGGSIYDTGQKANGIFIKQMYTGIYETLKAFVNGEVYKVDPDFYDTVIPNGGPRITDPTP